MGHVSVAQPVEDFEATHPTVPPAPWRCPRKEGNALFHPAAQDFLILRRLLPSSDSPVVRQFPCHSDGFMAPSSSARLRSAVRRPSSWVCRSGAGRRSPTEAPRGHRGAWRPWRPPPRNAARRSGDGDPTNRRPAASGTAGRRWASPSRRAAAGRRPCLWSCGEASCAPAGGSHAGGPREAKGHETMCEPRGPRRPRDPRAHWLWPLPWRWRAPRMGALGTFGSENDQIFGPNHLHTPCWSSAKILASKPVKAVRQSVTSSSEEEENRVNIVN